MMCIYIHIIIYYKYDIFMYMCGVSNTWNPG